jgi:hypothetical protein
MTLKEKLDETRAAFEKRAPQAAQDIMKRQTNDLRNSGILDRVVKVGARAPAFAASSHDGRSMSSDGLTAKGPLILSVFRGHW